MKVNWKLLKAVAAVLILITALYGGYRFVRRAEMSAPSVVQPAPGSRLFMSMDGFRFTQSENGQVALRIFAGNADLYESKEARLKNLEITFITPEKKEVALLGETGLLDTVTGNASVRGVNGEVRIVTSEGYLLTTNSLFWKAEQRLVTIPDVFKLLGKEIYLEGRGLSGNVDMRTIVVNGNVKAVLQE